MKKIIFVFILLVAITSVILIVITKPNTTKIVTSGDRSALNAAIVRGSVKVVFVGDSITAGSAVRYNKSWAALLSADLIKTYPNVKWQFVNLSLPGRGLLNAYADTYRATALETPALQGYFMPKHAGVFWPEGSTVGKSWKQTVIDEKPDLVVVAFGMNDISGDEEAYYKILLWLVGSYKLEPSPPSVALVTTPLPSRTAPEYIGLQDKIERTAFATRRAAIETNSTLIDATASYKNLRDGKTYYPFILLGGSESVLLGGGFIGEFIGGNGINHPSSLGHNLIYRPAYQGLLVP